VQHGLHAPGAPQHAPIGTTPQGAQHGGFATATPAGTGLVGAATTPHAAAARATGWVTGAYQSVGDAGIDRMLRLEAACKRFGSPV
jgi:hypothetical protein